MATAASSSACPDATEPAVYNLQGLLVNGGSTLQVVGPVILNVASGVILNNASGASGPPSSTPGWLRLNISSGALF